ncbi:MAG: hypothetical protein E7294_06220 [Lachnospiraceae bacterium]|nr:hypothetical protein [Lachnospiraceae bacterium]
MECPFCHREMKDGQVFCEGCGKEIHLVPLFEPEVEEKMSSSLQSVVETLNGTENAKDNTDATTEYTVETQKETGRSAKSRFSLYLIAIVAVLGAALSVLYCISKLSAPVDFSTYLQRAKDLYGLEKYDDAMKEIDRAFEEGTTSQELLQDAYLLKTKTYIYVGEVQKAVDCLKEGIDLLDDTEPLYKLWLQLEKELENYREMADILSDVTYESLLTEYSSYICNTPRFDVASGSYTEVVYLKLSDDGEGKIYYTINGDDPDASSDEYLSPVKLENGKFEIRAVFINKYGVMSPVTTAQYEIEIATPDEPEVSLESGTYHEPQVIDVFRLDDTYSVYYTTDGSTPDLSSIKYEDSILLPLGKSTFKFILYDEDGVASDVAERSYELVLENAQIPMEQAHIMLLQNLIINGTIQDIDGHVANSEDTRVYNCNTVFEAEGAVWYLFAESQIDSFGNSIKTGNLYSVNVENAEVCHAINGEHGNIWVEPLQ